MAYITNNAALRFTYFIITSHAPTASLPPPCPLNTERCEARPVSYFFPALIFAQRFLCAAATRARPAALIPRLFLGAASGALLPTMPPNSFSNSAIFSLSVTARCNWLTDRSAIFIGGNLSQPQPACHYPYYHFPLPQRLSPCYGQGERLCASPDERDQSGKAILRENLPWRSEPSLPLSSRFHAGAFHAPAI